MPDVKPLEFELQGICVHFTSLASPRVDEVANTYVCNAGKVKLKPPLESLNVVRRWSVNVVRARQHSTLGGCDGYIGGFARRTLLGTGLKPRLRFLLPYVVGGRRQFNVREEKAKVTKDVNPPPRQRQLGHRFPLWLRCCRFL